MMMQRHCSKNLLHLGHLWAAEQGQQSLTSISAAAQAKLDTAEVARQRQQHIGPNHALMYAEPLHIVRGEVR